MNTPDNLALSVISDGTTYDKRVAILAKAGQRALPRYRTICKAEAIKQASLNSLNLAWNAGIVKAAAEQVHAHMIAHRADNERNPNKGQA